MSDDATAPEDAKVEVEVEIGVADILLVLPQLSEADVRTVASAAHAECIKHRLTWGDKEIQREDA